LVFIDLIHLVSRTQKKSNHSSWSPGAGGIHSRWFMSLFASKDKIKRNSGSVFSRTPKWIANRRKPQVERATSEPCTCDPLVRMDCGRVIKAVMLPSHLVHRSHDAALDNWNQWSLRNYDLCLARQFQPEAAPLLNNVQNQSFSIGGLAVWTHLEWKTFRQTRISRSRLRSRKPLGSRKSRSLTGFAGASITCKSRWSPLSMIKNSAEDPTVPSSSDVRPKWTESPMTVSPRHLAFEKTPKTLEFIGIARGHC